MTTFARACMLLPAVVAATVPAVTLSNGVKMPQLSLGVYQYNDSQAEAAVVTAFNNGFSMVDGGEEYANNKGVGRGIKTLLGQGHQRKDMFIQAKIQGCGFNGLSTTTCYNGTAQLLQKQLTDLGLSYVDSAILHFPPHSVVEVGGCLKSSCAQIQAQWRAMVEFYKAGKTRAVGVSNYCKNCYTECLMGAGFDVLPMIHQIQYHLGMGPDSQGYVSFAKEHGMAVQAYSVLANKPHFYVWEPQGPNPQILHGGAFGGKLGEIAKAHNVSTIQVALKWIVQQGFTALTKSSDAKHLVKDAALWGWDLQPSELEVLNTEVKPWPMSGADHGLHGMPAWACHPPLGSTAAVRDVVV